MGINVTKTGSGTLGELKPGWSVSEFATPVNPVDSAGGTGNVTYGGRDATESLMLIGDDATFTEDTLGSISGVMRSVNQSGLSVDISQDNKLARFDATMNIPPLLASSVPCALDLADQLTGTVRLTQPKGIFWSLKGHVIGFDSTGDIVPFRQELTSYEYYNNSTAQLTTVNVAAAVDSVWGNSFGTVGSEVFATNLIGDTIVPRLANLAPGVFFVGARLPYVAEQISFKTLLNGQNLSFTMQGQPNIGATQGSGQTLTFNINYVAKTLTINAEYWSGGILTNTTDTQSLATLNLDAELGVFFYFRPWQGISFQNEYNPTVVVCNTSNYAVTLDAEITYQSDRRDTYFDPWQITGNVRALWRTDNDYYTTSPAWEPIVAEYEAADNFGYAASPTLGTPSRGVNDNLWAWLQDACAVYRWEITVEGDQIYARPVGGRAIDVDNYAPSSTVTPTLTFTGRQVNVNYSDATGVFNGEVYNARDDDNRIITVGAAQTTMVTVAANVYLFSAINPIRVTTFIPGAGTYYVVDSTGLPIVANQWEAYGASVSVAPSVTSSSGIDITVVGPTSQIPGTTAPYSLAVSDGTNQYAALSIFGSGLVYDTKVLNLLTGADPDKTPQQVATTVDNPFISTVEQAYDTGIWASIDASGPVVSLTLTIPTSSITSFGTTPGSIIAWRSSIYRVISSTVSKMGVDLQCVRHVTVADFDAVWELFDVNYHDSYWAGYEAKDQMVLPFAKLPEVQEAVNGFGLDPFGITPFGQ